MKYLLDTSTCIFYLRGNPSVCKKVLKIGFQDLYISEITVSELFYGAAKSQNVEKNTAKTKEFIALFKTLPIHPALLLFATEKARLNKLGTPLEDFDLLIGVSAVQHNMTMVTNNTRHFERVQHIILEDWFIK
jgi:tRNA(fMet)-specific endonuclease VapC